MCLAVERTVPFAPIVNTLVVLWYASVGHHPDDIVERRELAPWYRDKAQPSVLDMFTKLWRGIIAGYLRSKDPQPPTRRNHHPATGLGGGRGVVEKVEYTSAANNCNSRQAGE